MGIKLDMTQAASTIPVSVYKVALTDFAIKESKSSEYDYAALVLTVQEGEYAGYKLRTNLSFSPNAAFRVDEFLRAFGVNLDQMSTEEKRNFELELRDYQGMECNVYVEDETFNENLRSGIKKFLAPGEDAPKARGASKEESPRKRGAKTE